MGNGNPDTFGRQADEVRRLFGDLPIIEAKADFVVYVTAEEQEKSERGNPNNCMFSQACKRAFGSQGVLFYPTVAYVDMIDPNNASRRIVMRFRLPSETRKRLEQFDKGSDVVREATFILKAVPKGSTLQAMRVTKRKQNAAARRRKAGLDSEVSEERSEAAKKGRETHRRRSLMGIRQGTGGIHTREET